MFNRTRQNPAIRFLDRLSGQGLAGRYAGGCHCESHPCTCGAIADEWKRQGQAAITDLYPVYQSNWYVRGN